MTRRAFAVLVVVVGLVAWSSGPSSAFGPAAFGYDATAIATPLSAGAGPLAHGNQHVLESDAVERPTRDYNHHHNLARASARPVAYRLAPQATSLVDDAVTTGRTASTSWGRTIDDFQQYGDQWRRMSAHAEGATGHAYRGGTSIEEVFERGGDRLIRHRIYGPNGEILHETFRPYPKFGAP